MNAPQSAQITAQIPGEPREIARLTRGAEAGRWKSTQRGNALAAYPTARPVLNGGREETYRKATRLVPTQLRQQVSASVRQLDQ